MHDPPLVRSIAYLGAVVLTPVLMAVLSRLFPAPPLVSGDDDPLHRRTELLSRVVCLLSACGAAAFCIARHRNSPWMLGVLLGWMVAAPVLFIAVCTLPSGGLPRWRQFWRFYAHRYQIGLGFIAPAYVVCVALAVVSTVELLLPTPA